ncbi:putative ATPase [Microbotryomycetes sp. JL221]|nr:putative ATPase [Microbotryomycetes sp. JL221]
MPRRSTGTSSAPTSKNTTRQSSKTSSRADDDDEERKSSPSTRASTPGSTRSNSKLAQDNTPQHQNDQDYSPPEQEHEEKDDDAQQDNEPRISNKVRAHFDKLMEKTRVFTEAIQQDMNLNAEAARQEQQEALEQLARPKANKKRKSTGSRSAAGGNDNEKQPQQPQVPPPDGFVGQLKHFQQEGLEWLVTRHMHTDGTGKTIQTIAFLCKLRQEQIYGFNIVVCPKPVLYNWASEFKRFAPDFPVIVYDGTKEEREAKLDQLEDLERRGVPYDELMAKGIAPELHYEHATKAQQAVERKKPCVLVAFSRAVLDVVLLARKSEKTRPRYRFNIMVIDEAHRIKNSQSKTHKLLKMYQTDFRLLLTGTPLQNDLGELYSLLSFILPRIFNDAELWRDMFNFDALVSGEDEKLSKEDEMQLIVLSLHGIIKPFMLRRLKKEVQKDLPLKKEYVLKAPMTPRQKELYVATKENKLRNLLISESAQKVEDDKRNDVVTLSSDDENEAKQNTGKSQTVTERSRGRQRGRKRDYTELTFDEWYDRQEQGLNDEKLTAEEEKQLAIKAHNKKVMSRVNNQRLASMIMSLRLIANHPFLIDEAANGVLDDEEWQKHVVPLSGKMMLLNRLLTKLFDDGHKVIVFSQFTKQLEIIHLWAENAKGWGVYRIDGANPAVQEEIEDFNTNQDPDAAKLYLVSTRAGGVGLNLIGADTVILFDSDWNPQSDLQAMDRAHRIGQEKPVLVFRFETENSIDGLLIERATRKRKLEHVVLGADFAGNDDAGELVDKARGRNTTRTKQTNEKQMEDLLQRLTATEGQTIEFEAGDQVLTDAQLDELLDRSFFALQVDAMTGQGSSAARSGKKGKSTKSAVFQTVETVADDEDEEEEDANDNMFDIEGEKSAAEAAKERRGRDMDDEIEQLDKTKSKASSVAGSTASSNKRRKR